MQKLQLGLVATVKETVLHTNTASALGSGGLDVYATPAMVALMEQAAVSAIRPALAEGSGSVGTLLNIRHERATLPGSRVSASAELVEIDGRRLVFKVRAEDESLLQATNSWQNCTNPVKLKKRCCRNGNTFISICCLKTSSDVHFSEFRKAPPAALLPAQHRPP